MAKQRPFVTSKKIKNDLELETSTSTIRRRLMEAELYGRSPRKVPHLSKKNIAKRLKFASEHIIWPLSKWRNILWIDESKKVLFIRLMDVDNMFENPDPLHLNHSSLLRQLSMVGPKT